ncbi:serine/threonine-protein kinase [Actinomadura welshii]|uniref:serine/threonine-protein kinase n=1 Tax=Actinomadura welshii TaxID=3103817 RepID=UPI0003AD27FB|nr:serine/threonine-protein kinase [Actinomadura madurae]
MDGEWRVDGFTEVRELGSGAQGRVVLARHEASGTPVAIKYLPAGADEAERERLRHEALMLGQADSPHVARLFRLIEGPETSAIVMEAVDGVSLKELLARHRALGPEASLAVLKGSLLGLAAAHAVGVVHRDYKPANVVVPADGRSRLVDFGIATPAGEEAGGAGTPYYMAPEQWSRHVATPASDVYAATCVFVECVTGERPYTGDRAALMRAHLTGDVPVEDVPEALRDLVRRGMAKAPEDRPDGAAAFVDDLERAARETYGGDWEASGVRTLAASAAALAVLFPLAAWLVPGAAGAVGTAGTVAGTAGTAGAVSGTASASTAGNVAGASAVKAFLGSGAGLAAVSVGTVVVVGAAAFTVDRATRQDPEPTPTVTRAAATVADVRSCPVTGPGGGPISVSPGPAKVTLPAQVRMPRDTVVYWTQQGPVIGPSGGGCEGSMGVNSGLSTAGDVRTALVVQEWQGSVGGIRSSLCQYFPDSPQAERERAEAGDCTSGVTGRQDIPTGVPGVLAMMVSEPPSEPPPSPYVSAKLSTLGTKGVAWPISCTAPLANADICTAALTYWYVQGVQEGRPAKADLDRAAKRIADFVASSRR